MEDARRDMPTGTVDMPTCTVVVPVRDDADHLRRFLMALERQSLAVEDVVVVDNASTDDSAAVARAWGARVVHEPAVGIAVAAAAGYDSATGDVVIRADADTVPGTEWVNSLLRRFDEGEDVMAVSGPGRFYGGPRLLRTVASTLYIGGYCCAAALALGHAPLFGTNLAFRRSWWRRVRSEVHVSDRVHDDMDLSFRLRPAERVVFDWRIPVGMSARPLSTEGAVRLRRAVETLRVNWADEPPWERWRMRIAQSLTKCAVTRRVQ